MAGHVRPRAKQAMISVILPVTHPSGRLRECLSALSRQTLPPSKYEVVVVNTTSVSLPVDNTGIKNLQVRSSEGANMPCAYNHGVEAAKGKYCLFICEDILPDPELVERHLNLQSQIGGALAAGQVIYTAESLKDPYGRQFANWKNNRQSSLCRGRRIPSWLTCSTENFSVPRQAAIEAGCFSTHLNREFALELAFRLDQQGLPVVYLPEAKVTKLESMSSKEVAREICEQASSYVMLWRKHTGMLPKLFGGFFQTSQRGLFLRRLFLALRINPLLLIPIIFLYRRNDSAEKWFEFWHDLLFWSEVRKALSDRYIWKRLVYGVPILFYHAFSTGQEASSRYVVSQKNFARQLDWLKRLGYRAISLEEYLQILSEHRLPPVRSFLLTMDDGYEDNYSLAFPVLHQHQFPATIFLITGKMGAVNDWVDKDEITLLHRPILTWKKAREMLKSGISFGAHTHTHPYLPSISSEQVQQEALRSKEEIEKNLGVPVRVFSFPYGGYNQDVRAGIEKVGFEGAVTVKMGLNSHGTPLTELRRIEIYGNRSILRFLWMIWFLNDQH